MLTSLRIAIYSISRGQCRNINSKSGTIDRSKFPVIKEDELEEKFINGWGPGGQAVNKTINCCQLKHKPTGIVVKVHHTRYLEQNRKLAREILATKLDNFINGEDSVENQKYRIAQKKLATKEYLAQKRRDMKKRYNEEIKVR